MKAQTTRHYLNIFAVLILSGIFIAPLMVDPELNDPTRMGKIFFFVRWMLLVIPAGLAIGILNLKQPVDKWFFLVLAFGAWIIPEAIGLLNRSTGYYQDEFTGTIRGSCYQGLGEYDKAETQYQQASHMVPHKFYPLYLFAQLYHATGQTKKAAAIAKEILGKAVKVTSKAIEEMKEEMKQLINTNASLQNSNEPEAKRLEACTREQTASSLDPSFTRKEVWSRR